MDAHADAMLADESDLVLYLILNHLRRERNEKRREGKEKERISVSTAVKIPQL